MNKFILFTLFFIFSSSSYAGIYQDIAGAAQMVSDSFNEVYTFFFNDIPSLAQRFFAWFIVWFVKAQLFLKLKLMTFAWGVAQVIISDLNIMSEITSQVSSLPQDIRQAIVDMRLLDGMNLLLNAYVTKFVMKFL